MIFHKQVVLGLGVAYAASPFSRVDAVAFPHAAAETGDEKSLLDTIARKLADKAGKGAASNGAGHSDTSKGGKNPPSSSKAHKDPITTPFFVASASCAGDCMSASYSPDSNFLTNAIQPCDANSLHQEWDLLQHGTFTMVKSVGASADSTDDWCVGVVPQEVGFMMSNVNDKIPDDLGADGLMFGIINVVGNSNMETMIDFAGSFAASGDGWVDHDMCSNGATLGLVRCGDPASQWYPTDGQLLSALCWSHGFTSLLTAEGCNELSLSTTTATDGATVPITRAETFMVVDKEFIESIPPPAPTYAPTTPAPTTNSQVGDDHFDLEGNFQVSPTASVGTPVPGWTFCDKPPDVVSLLGDKVSKVTGSGVLTLQVGGKIKIAENKCRKTVYVLVPVDDRLDPVCQNVDSFTNGDGIFNLNGNCEIQPENCVEILGGPGTTNFETETGQAYVRIENDLNVGTIECDTLVIEQWDTGSTSGGMGYYYDDKPFDTY